VSPLLTAYQPAAGFYDELLERPGEPRPHYARLIQDLEQFGAPELRHRWDTCRRLVREQGITYNVYDAPGPRERPWQLDPLPFVISADEWRTLETGLVQRATVLNRILSDCYGPQELIRSRWLSPAMVFAQPDFLRPCHGVAAPGGVFLHFYAADLARSPDGRWWVISDRTQVPTGAGYALANRLVTSRILPEAFRDHCVHRLAGFFRDTRNALAQLAPRQAENARVVLLTSGPLNETYFEQAYLARYLGYMLVEGQDLMVRDDRVFLKTLGGLEPVDVILRRLDDDYCDPLELRNDSLLGVPGLLEALRAGNVAIANSLGSGLVESPAFLAFLPGLCRHLLGEELKLPSVATWWCGQKAARQYAFDHLGELIVKPAFRGGSGAIDPSAGLTKAARETLRRRIEFDPDLFVAQERLDFSQAPVWDGNALAPRTIGLRVFLVASGGGYRVMPGALARISPDAGERFLSMQRGGGAKDTWVLSETPVEDVSLLRGYRPSIELGRTGNNLPSRLADNFFWLGRYAERADATARLLRTALARFDPERTTGALPLLSPLLRTLEIQGQLPGLSEKPELRVNAEAFEAELLAAIFDPARPGSLRSLAGQLQRLAMLVRDRTSNDMWRALSRVNERLAMPPARKFMLAGEARGVLTDTLLGLAAFHGLARENMTRAQGWRFLDMGLRIERALYLGTLLHSMLHAPEADDPSVLEAVLDVADSSITFRSRYSLLPHVPSVLDLLLLDERNPRSVLFQLNQLARHFNQLPPEREQAPGSGSMLLRDCLARIDRVESREHPAASVKPAASAAAAALGGILRDLPRISNAIAASYFAHSTLSRTGRDQAG
jgi:uncharacterized circularly permuted ATP-grasp superfamily protein/uncharacterized alpha-E superfamily protein